MLDHFIAENATAHKVNNSYCTVAISYCTFCVEKHTILGLDISYSCALTCHGLYIYEEIYVCSFVCLFVCLFSSSVCVFVRMTVHFSRVIEDGIQHIDGHFAQGL